MKNDHTHTTLGGIGGKYRLIFVPQLFVFSVRHIAELDVCLVVCSRRVSPVVLPAVVEEQDRHSTQNCNLDGYNGNLGRRVVRSVFITECQRPEDVAETERHQ